MSDHLIVLPAIDPAQTLACINSMASEMRDRLLVVDNTDDCSIARGISQMVHCVAHGENLGVARSWNLGIQEEPQFLTLCSTSMRFHGDGGAALLRTADMAISQSQWPWGFESMNGWHLFTLGHRTWEVVGEFDQRFYPAYFEDNDYIWRMRCWSILEPRGDYFKTHPDFENFAVRRVPWIGALQYEMVGDAMTIRAGLVEVDMEHNRQLYVRRWGGEPGHETVAYPIVDEEYDV